MDGCIWRLSRPTLCHARSCMNTSMGEIDFCAGESPMKVIEWFVVTKQLEVSREGVHLVDTPSTDWLILKHCFMRQKEAHMLLVCFSIFCSFFATRLWRTNSPEGHHPCSLTPTLLPDPYKAARFQLCLSAFLFQCWRKKKGRRTNNRILNE